MGLPYAVCSVSTPPLCCQKALATTRQLKRISIHFLCILFNLCVLLSNTNKTHSLTVDIIRIFMILLQDSRDASLEA